MIITIKSTNFELTPHIKEHIESKLSFLNKFVIEEDSVCRVEVGRTTNHHKNGEVYRAEVRIVIEGKEYYVSSERFDLYVAIDEVKDSLMREITSRKEKKEAFVKRSGKKIKNMIKGFFTKNNDQY